MRRRREELFGEWTGEHLQGRYKNNMYTFGLQPGVLEENNRAEKKTRGGATRRRQLQSGCDAEGLVKGSSVQWHRLWGKIK